MAVFADDIRLEVITASALEPALLLPFDENTSDYSSDGHSPSTATGGIIFPAHITPQVGGGCVQLAEATTNLIVNPSIEVDTTGWTLNQGGTGGAITRDTSKSFVGSASLRIDLGTAWTEAYSATISLADGESLTIQARVYADSTSGVNIQIRDTTNGVTRVTDYLSQTGAWEFLTCTWTNDTGSAADVRVQLHISTDGASQAWFDAIQAEKKSYPTPYCDGSLGDGHSWSGTAHNSTSSRTRTTLEFDADAADIQESEGTFATWIMLPYTPGDQSGTIDLFGWWDTANSEALRLSINSNGKIFAHVYSGGVLYVAFVHDVTDWGPYEWHHAVFVWKQDDCRLYVDGALEASDTSASMANIASAVFAIGGQPGTIYNRINGWLDDTVVLDRTLTDAEAAALYAAGNDGFAAPRILYDIYDDVAETVRVTYGIKGQQPNLRVASPGYLDFVLDNSENNSGATMGYYSPQYANRRTGWGHGEAARLAIEYDSDTYYKFHGRITKIQPSTGKYGDLEVKCRAQDWIADAVYLTPTGLEVQATKRGDELLTELLAATTKQPPATDFDQGDQTFSYAFDEVRDGQTTRGDSDIGGTLVFESNTHRAGTTDIFFSMDDDGDSDDYDNLVLEESEQLIYNNIRGWAYPRTVDSDASAQVLWALQESVTVPAGETVTIIGEYRDSDNPDVRIGGLDIITPTSDDWAFSAGADSDWVVSATIGGNATEFDVTNNTGGSADITKLQARGKRVLTYEPVLAEAEDADSIAEYGDRNLRINMPYESNVNNVQSLVDSILSEYKDPRVRARTVTFTANRNDAMMRAALGGEPGKRISLVDSVNGVAGDYFIQGVSLNIERGGLMRTTWYLLDATAVSYFRLDVSSLDGSDVLY